MIKFLVTAVFAVIALFVLALLFCLMIWVVAKLLRFLFPQKFSNVQQVESKVKKKGSKKKEEPAVSFHAEDRCKTCKGLGACPVAFSGSVSYPCPTFVPKDEQ